MMEKLTQPIKWHGGKSYLAPKIVALMPPRCKNPNAPAPDDPGWLHYVEPYAGGLSVLLENDPEGISEVVNDLNEHLVNFWYTLASVDRFQRFNRVVQAIPFSEYHYQRAQAQMHDIGDDQVLAARDFFVHCRQSLSGRMKGFAGITRNRTRRGMNEQVSAWLNAIEGLPAVHARLMRVLILNKPALEVIRKEDGPRTLFYLDPPYMHETRATKDEYGDNEMGYVQHEELLKALVKIKGRFLLSGYQSNLYDCYRNTSGWNSHEFKIDNKASGGKTKRVMTECIWTNF